jgi:hypothetical protein
MSKGNFPVETLAALAAELVTRSLHIYHISSGKENKKCRKTNLFITVFIKK